MRASTHTHMSINASVKLLSPIEWVGLTISLAAHAKRKERFIRPRSLGALDEVLVYILRVRCIVPRTLAEYPPLIWRGAHHRFVMAAKIKVIGMSWKPTKER